jgi:hypothetical protein
MEKVIACCGINCNTCDARKATLTNDNSLREKTAAAWSAQFNANITADMINCTGCIEPGAKFSHCSNCEIRKCAQSKGFKTCANCSELETCEILKGLTQYVPDALDNLKSLN